jgi:ribonuclease R
VPGALSSTVSSHLPLLLRFSLCVAPPPPATGQVERSRVFEGFMRSRAKLTYPNVARALGLAKNATASPDAEEMRDDLTVMWDLSRLLRARRLRRGALDFDLPEARVVLDDETGAPIDVEKRAHDPGVKKAYQLIEEMMLLANETVARELVSRTIPTIFRCHAPPASERLERFVSMCGVLDVPFDLEEAADPKRLAAFLKRISAHPQKHVLHSLLLRAMKQASYDVVNVGHFGLASTAYLHFTSPIRRYPDLVVHRAVRAMLQHERVDKSPEAEDRLRLAATTASDCERRAMDVEREIVDLYRALYMRAFIGSIYEGTVSAIVGTGMFVALDKPFVDVLVRLDTLGPDTYEIDESGLAVNGVRSGERIKLGDTMVVQVEDVAVLRRSIYGRRVVVPSEADGAPEERKRKVKARRETIPSEAARPERRKASSGASVERSSRDARGAKGKNGKPDKKTKKLVKAKKKTRH